jgi:hypothetical protein
MANYQAYVLDEEAPNRSRRPVRATAAGHTVSAAPRLDGAAGASRVAGTGTVSAEQGMRSARRPGLCSERFAISDRFTGL